MICANEKCLKGFVPSKFAGNQKYCCDNCMRTTQDKLYRKNERAIKRRVDNRAEAKSLGLSTKKFLADKHPCNKWNYMAEVIRRRCKKSGIICDISPSMLKNLYIKQNKICPITGWAMLERKSGIGYSPLIATVDRIDSNIGYIESNIRLVCFIANNAKYTYSDLELLAFCKAVIKHQEAT